MASLLDQLFAPPEQAVQGSAQQQLEQQVRAKTGQAGLAPSGPSASNVTEQLAQQQAQGNQLALQQQAQQQQAQISQQAQNVQQQQALQAKQEAANFRAQQQQLAQKTTDLLQGLQQSNQELEFRKDAAQVEQAAQTMALRNKNYVNNLAQIGEEQRLQDKQAFDREAERVVFGDQWDRLNQEIGFKTALSADQRTFNQALAGMKTEDALAMAQAALSAKQRAAVATGVIGMASAGAQAYDKYTPATTGSLPTVPGQTQTLAVQPIQTANVDFLGNPIKP